MHYWHLLGYVHAVSAVWCYEITTEQACRCRASCMDLHYDGKNLKRNYTPLFGIAMNTTDSFDSRKTLRLGPFVRCIFMIFEWRTWCCVSNSGIQMLQGRYCMYRKVLRHRLKHFQCVGLTCLMFHFSQSWSWICLLSTMFTLENLSWKPYEYTTWRICMDHFVTCNVSQCWHTCLTMISHVHMIIFTYMVYAHIYIYIHVFVYTWPYFCNIWTYTVYLHQQYMHIWSHCTHYFYVRESASSSWVSTWHNMAAIWSLPPQYIEQSIPIKISSCERLSLSDWWNVVDNFKAMPVHRQASACGAAAFPAQSVSWVDVIKQESFLYSTHTEKRWIFCFFPLFPMWHLANFR